MVNSTGQKLLICITRDKCTKNLMNNRIKREILIMVKPNIGTELGVCNGSMGTIVDIKLDEREDVDYKSSDSHYLSHHPDVYIKLDRPPDKDGNIPVVKHC